MIFINSLKFSQPPPAYTLQNRLLQTSLGYNIEKVSHNNGKPSIGVKYIFRSMETLLLYTHSYRIHGVREQRTAEVPPFVVSIIALSWFCVLHPYMHILEAWSKCLTENCKGTSKENNFKRKVTPST